MFDIGFWELVMVGVVALVVIGPKDLPRVARMAGLWVGRARRSLSVVKAEIDREFKAQELQDLLKKRALETQQALNTPVERILEEDPRPVPPPSVTGTDTGPVRPQAGAEKV